MPEQESPIIYKSGMIPGLPGWDVMLVLQRNKGVSVALARDANGTIIRNIDYNLWEEVSNEEALRVYRKYFDDRDNAYEEKAASEDTPPYDQ